MSCKFYSTQKQRFDWMTFITDCWLHMKFTVIPRGFIVIRQRLSWWQMALMCHLILSLTFILFPSFAPNYRSCSPSCCLSSSQPSCSLTRAPPLCSTSRRPTTSLSPSSPRLGSTGPPEWFAAHRIMPVQSRWGKVFCLVNSVVTLCFLTKMPNKIQLNPYQWSPRWPF